MTVHRPDRTALLVVDVQRGAVDRGPHRVDSVLETIAMLLRAARDGASPVVFVQHDDGPGSDCQAGTEAWEIHPRVLPRTGEHVAHKRHNSAFRDTELEIELDAAGVGRLVVVGIQTEYCVDTTVRVAFELGYDVVVPREGHTTYDNGEITAAQLIELYNERIFDGRFATVLDTHECAALLNAGDSP